MLEKILSSSPDFVNTESSFSSPLGKEWEITQPPPEDSQNDSLFSRLRKWARQAAYRKIISTKAATYCHRAIAPRCLPDGSIEPRHFVEIWKSETGDFSYGGLVTCGNVWLCPVCASKISEKRRIELSQALDVAEARGFEVLHLTLTAPHHLGESLDDLLEKMAHARRLMLNRKTWKRIKGFLGLQGTIRALEVTHSWLNGWHVHFHVLMITSCRVSDDASLRNLQEMMFEPWAAACESVGLERPSSKHGLILQDGRAAGEYVSKWGVEHEMTKAHIKKGREGGLSPFQFLDKYLEGDDRYKDLFQEYAKDFKGRKQLVWSKGLRELLKLEPELSDEEISESEDPDSDLFGKIPLEVWNVILKRDIRGEVLEVCRGGEDHLKKYLDEIMTRAREREKRWKLRKAS
jgi:hypothetical protein